MNLRNTINLSNASATSVETNGTESRPTESDRHRLLAVERRRVLVDVLADHRSPISLAELAKAVAGRETDGRDIDAGTVERITIALHHQHLPLMAEAGVVDYDPDSKRVEVRRTAFDRLTR